jgi:hypothetical protein
MSWGCLRRGALTILIPCHVASDSANTPARELSLSLALLFRDCESHLSTRLMVYKGNVHRQDFLSSEMKHRKGGSNDNLPA